jgi:hypothetical protein
LPSNEELKKVHDDERADGFGLLPGVPEEDMWGPPRYDKTLLESGQELKHHVRANCSGNCCLHGTSVYPSCRTPRQWRNDRGIIEHLCPHGIGHPCLAGVEYAMLMAPTEDAIFDVSAVHGCDGCCQVVEEMMTRAEGNDQSADRDDLPEDRLRKLELDGFHVDGRLEGIDQRIKWLSEDIQHLEAEVNRRITTIGWVAFFAIFTFGLLIFVTK